MKQPLYIGIDAGGSGVRAVLGSADGTILALLATDQSTGDLAGSVRPRRAVYPWWHGVFAPLAYAAASADGCVVHVHGGLAGISIPGKREPFQAAVRELLPDAKCDTSTDALVAAWGAFAGRAGVAVLAGTGSIALAGAGSAYPARTGGYGYLLGDEGSGFWITREGLAAALRAADGIGPATLVTELICEALGSSDIREAAGWLYDQRHPVATLAALSPVIARAAQHGDAGAAKILMQAGSALARLGAAAARRVWPDGFPAVVEVAQCGGVWKAGGQLHIAFTAQLAQDLPGAHIVPPLLPPVAGALLLALRQVDACAPSPAVISRVQGQLEHR